MKNLKETLILLLKLNSTPKGISLGIATGVFIGITPLYGFHTLMVIIAALLTRHTNKVAILIGTNVSIPPTMPFITWAGYAIGRAVLGGAYPVENITSFKHITYQSISNIYFALLIGSLILGIVCAIIAYFVTYIVLSRKEERKRNIA